MTTSGSNLLTSVMTELNSSMSASAQGPSGQNIPSPDYVPLAKDECEPEEEDYPLTQVLESEEDYPLTQEVNIVTEAKEEGPATPLTRFCGSGIDFSVPFNTGNKAATLGADPSTNMFQLEDPELIAEGAAQLVSARMAEVLCLPYGHRLVCLGRNGIRVTRGSNSYCLKPRKKGTRPKDDSITLADGDVVAFGAGPWAPHGYFFGTALACENPLRIQVFKRETLPVSVFKRKTGFQPTSPRLNVSTAFTAESKSIFMSNSTSFFFSQGTLLCMLKRLILT